MASPTPVAYVPPPRRRSMAGPLILIIIGVMFLLGNMHIVSGIELGRWFARYWPVLLILWGGVRLIEYYTDRQHGYPPRGIGGGGVLFLILLIVTGLSFSAAEHVNWSGINEEFGPDDDNPLALLVGKTYTYNSTVPQQPFPANASLVVISDRGDVNVHSWNDQQIKVAVTKKLRASDESEAQKVDQSSQPTITVEGNMVKVNAHTAGVTVGVASNVNIRSDLDIWVPANAAVDISTRHGDVTVKERSGNVKVSNSHGDIDIEDIQGNVDADERSGNVRVVKASGDVSLTGNVNDSTVTDVAGAVKLDGDFFGDMNLSRVAKGVTFRSSRTDLAVARLDGDLTMESGDLRANQLFGPVRVLTRSKDIHLDDFAGELRVEDSNANVEIHSIKMGPMQIQNQSGDVQVSVPQRANFEAELRTRNGDINSDFEALSPKTTNDESRAAGTVGSVGGPKVQITNEHGNIDIRKSSQT